MVFYFVNSFDDLEPGSYNIMEPSETLPVFDKAMAETANVVCIVPAVVFDKKGFRIGYGGGYYDRFLALEPNHPTIALCYDFQMCDTLEPESHDIPVDMVLSI